MSLSSKIAFVKKVLLLTSLIAILFTVAHGQTTSGRYDNIALYNSGGVANIVGGALIKVCTATAVGTPCSPPILIYKDAALTQPLANPFNADISGNFFFYAAPQKVTIQISGAGLNTFSYANVTIPNDPQSPNFNFLTAATLDVSGLSTFNDVVINGTCTGSGCGGGGGGTIGGSIAVDQIPVGSGANTIAGFNFFLFSGASGNESVPGINNFVYIDGNKHTSLQECINTAGANGTCVIPPNKTVSVSTSVTMTTNSTALRCEPGSVILKAANIDMIVISGMNDLVDGCVLNGAQSGGFTGANLILSGAINTTLQNNVFENAAGISSLYLTNSSQNLITSNRFVGNLQGSIFGEKNSNGNIIKGNYVDASASTSVTYSAITLHGTLGGNTVDLNKVVDNYILGGASFCIEIGGFGGTASLDEASSNSCYATRSSLGGYSTGASAQFINIHDNFYHSGNNPISIGGIELAAGVTDSNASHNIIQFQTGVGSLGFPITVSGSSAQRNIIDSNIITGFQAGVLSAGIVVTTSIASGVMSDNIISNNIITFPFGNPGIGIWVQCNNSSAQCNQNTIQGNHIIGDFTAGSTGIQLDDSGAVSMQENLIAQNNIHNTALGIKIATGVTNTRLVDGVNSATVKISDSGTGTGYAFALLGDGCGQLVSTLMTSTLSPCGTGGGGGANQQLSNLTGTVAINQTLNHVPFTRLIATGSPLITGDFSLGSGWGSTASVGSVVGTDQGFSFTVTSTGTGQTINPTVLFTFHDGAWSNTPIYACGNNGGTGTRADIDQTATSTTIPMIWDSTPIAGLTYIITCTGIGR